MRPSYLLASFLFLAACGGGDYAGSFGDDSGFGATPGGVKDMRFARELIAAGQVPPPEALLVEGMFAEHDLGLTGDPCAETLCLRAAGGVAPDRAGTPHGWLQVGLSSNVNPDTWQPPPTTYIYTVDVSGSMGWEYADDPSPGTLARDLLHRLADQLRDDDEVAIVTYGTDVSTALAITGGENADVVVAPTFGWTSVNRTMRTLLRPRSTASRPISYARTRPASMFVEPFSESSSISACTVATFSPPVVESTVATLVP